MVAKAEDYRWSGAAAHCGLRENQLLSRRPAWRRQRQQILDWPSWLAESDEPQRVAVLRRSVEKGLPCGTEKFVQRLEKISGRILQYRPIGRPKKKKG